ncbi:MAG: serine hydrolase domain-containing protein [Bacteroidales bacterium]
MKKLLFFLIFLGHNCFAGNFDTDTSELQSYFDGLITAHLDNNNIAGATVSFVQGDSLLFSKGYGYADVADDSPVSPDKTLFRIGSVSKLFVWTAIMQLYEEGRLELDTDVNNYLSEFSVPGNYEEPITLKDIMTHSAGFEEYILGLFAKDTSAMKPLGEILGEQMPHRVRPPGIFSSYSNHATAIAASVVEEVSGMAFNEYVEANILEPLGMKNTTFRQPVPENIEGNLSKGYNSEDGELKEKYFEYVPLYPVGGASSTGEDMAVFMLAFLHGGAYNGGRILDSATVSLMQSPAFQHSENVNPMCYGLMDMSYNNVKVLGHGGDTFWFHSLFAFIPEEQIGFFVSFNSQGGGGTYSMILEEFMDEYFPIEPEEPEYTMTEDNLSRFEGDYRANRYPHHRITKLMALDGDTKISATEDGSLKVKADKTSYYSPAGSLTFVNKKNSKIIEFKEDEEGEITHMFRGQQPIVAYEKVALSGKTSFHRNIFIFSLVVYIITLLYWPLAYFIRKEYNKPISSHLPFRYKFTGWLASFLFVAFLVIFSGVMSDSNQIVFGVPYAAKVALSFSLAGTIATVLIVFFNYKIWASNKYSRWGKIHYTALMVALLLSIWQLSYWNLIGFQY